MIIGEIECWTLKHTFCIVNIACNVSSVTLNELQDTFKMAGYLLVTVSAVDQFCENNPDNLLVLFVSLAPFCAFFRYYCTHCFVGAKCLKLHKCD